MCEAGRSAERICWPRPDKMQCGGEGMEVRVRTSKPGRFSDGSAKFCKVR